MLDVHCRVRIKKLKMRHQLPAEHQIPFQLLVAGVGFLQDEHKSTKHYQIISHGGDYLGTLPYFQVMRLIEYMDKLGVSYERTDGKARRRHRRRGPGRKLQEYGITYGWKNLIPYEINEALQDKFFHSPIEAM